MEIIITTLALEFCRNVIALKRLTIALLFVPASLIPSRTTSVNSGISPIVSLKSKSKVNSLED